MQLYDSGVLVWIAAVVHIWVFGTSNAVIIPIMAILALGAITVVVEPAVVVSGLLREEMTLRVVLTDGLTVGGRGDVSDVSDLILSLGTGHTMDKVVLAGEVFLSVVTVL